MPQSARRIADVDACCPSTPSPSHESEPPPILDVEVAHREMDFAEALRVITRKHGKTLQQILMDIARTSFGPGKLAFSDYLAFRLFDEDMLAGADKSAFVGLDASRRIWMTANYDSNWWGLAGNKLAATTLLGGYGYPVIPTMALYSDALAIRNAPLLRTEAALAGFLRDAARYPLFGKPMDSLRSLGSASFDAYDAATDTLIPAFGAPIAVETFAREVAATFGAGYILQHRVRPHESIRAIVGDRLATCRVLTVRADSGVRVHRAVWKIPAGTNVADNFWRGNLLATLDLETGRVLRVVHGVGLAQEQVTHHPDTKAELIGFEIPGWKELTSTACAAASALGGIRLVGWDMAATDAGPVIVEPNYTPDFDMVQMADRRGILEPQFEAFLEECRRAARSAKRRLRGMQVAEARDGMREFGKSMGL